MREAGQLDLPTEVQPDATPPTESACATPEGGDPAPESCDPTPEGREGPLVGCDPAPAGYGAVDHSRFFCWLIRAGFASRAITYGVIGGLTLTLAVGAGTFGAAPDQQGALALIARSLPGRLILIAITGSLLAYAIWKLGQAVRGRGPEGGGGKRPWDRVANLSGGLVYLLFFAVAVGALLGTDSDGSGAPRQAAAGVLAWPGGPVLVGLAGVGLIGISLYQIYDALSGGFAEQCWTDDMHPHWHRAFMHLGRVGLVARAGVFAMVGCFIIRTAIQYNAGSTVGIDGALERLRDHPDGPWLVGIAGVGLLIFAAFSLAEGRHRQL